MANPRGPTTGIVLLALVALLVVDAQPAQAGSAPTCFGSAATIWVDSNNIIHSTNSAQDGQVYAGILEGTSSADVIVGTSGPDTIYGRSGNDTICGLDGADVIYGGEGGDAPE